MKETKDLARNVRVNSKMLESLQADGWTIQKIVDWAMPRLKGKKYQTKDKK